MSLHFNDAIPWFPSKTYESTSVAIKVILPTQTVVGILSFCDFRIFFVVSALLSLIFGYSIDKARSRILDMDYPANPANEYLMRATLVLVSLIINYTVQRFITELVIDRTKIANLSKQVSAIFLSQAEGVIIYKQNENKKLDS